MGALSKFVVTFALPLALFRVLSSQDFSKIANVNYLIGVALGSGVTFLTRLLVGLIWSRVGLTEASLLGMGCAMSNGIMIGIPVTVLIFGEVGPTAVEMMLLVQSFVLMTLAVVLYDFGQAQGRTAANGLAMAIVSARAFFDLDFVVIDGNLPAHLLKRIVKATSEAINKYDLRGIDTPTIKPGQLGNDARAFGAALLPLRATFELESLPYTN